MPPGRDPTAERWPPLSKRRNISSAERRTLFALGKIFPADLKKVCGTFLSAGYFLPGRAKNMKPVKAFASCTARCASYGAAVLHILRHCRKMLHKSASRLCRKVYGPLQTRGHKEICLYLSGAKHKLFFSAYFVKIRFFQGDERRF